MYSQERREPGWDAKEKGAPGWLSQVSVWLLVLAQITISQFCEIEPRVRLCADSVEPAWDSLFLSLSVPPLLVHSLSKVNE